MTALSRTLWPPRTLAEGDKLPPPAPASGDFLLGALKIWFSLQISA